jgi:hypothetical protein
MGESVTLLRMECHDGGEHELTMTEADIVNSWLIMITLYCSKCGERDHMPLNEFIMRFKPVMISAPRARLNSNDVGYYQTHRDDEAEWGEPLPVTHPSRRLDAMISVRLSGDEADEIRAAAQATNVSVSTFLRTAALLSARGGVLNTDDPAAAE